MVERASGLKIDGMVEGASALRADGDKCSVPQPQPSPVACVCLRPLLKRLGKHAGSFMGHGKPCSHRLLKQFKDNEIPINDDWKGDHPDLVQVAGCIINDIVQYVHNYSNLVLLEAISLAACYKVKSIRAKCSLSIKDCSSFRFEQLSRIVGACNLHIFTNRHIAPQPVQNFNNSMLGVRPNTLSDAVEQDASHECQYWQRKGCDRTPHDVFAKLRQSCRSGVGMESILYHNYAPTFSTNSPFNSKRYDESANKLNISGAYPQTTRGQQCVFVAPTQFLALSMLPASATGVTFKSQRCLSSRIAVCYGKCAHPWQSTLKYLAVMWTK